MSGHRLYIPAHILVETGQSDTPEITRRSTGGWATEIARVEANLARAGTTVHVLPPLDQTTVHRSQPHLATIRREDTDIVVTTVNAFKARAMTTDDPGSVGEALAFARQWLQAEPMTLTRVGTDQGAP